MGLPRIYVGLCLVLGSAIVGHGQNVTETKWVDDWESGQGRTLLRKINSRWWTQDNREVYPPSKGGVFWQVDSKPGVCQFFHHHPFALSRAESLRLFMNKQEVEAALGSPNRIFGTDSHARWYYYTSNGTKLDVWFVDDGVLGEAKYYAIGEKSWSVESVERDLNGRNLFAVLAERASQRSAQQRAERQQSLGDQVGARRQALRGGIHSPAGIPRIAAQPRVVTVEADAQQGTSPPAIRRSVPAQAFAAIRPGSSRDDVLSKLGEPSGRFAIAGAEEGRESFTYDLDDGRTGVIRFAGGKVVEAR